MEPDAFELQVIEPRELSVAGNKILVCHDARIRGAGSGIEMDVDSWAVWTVDDAGLAIRLEVFLPHEEAEALEAAGLREWLRDRLESSRVGLPGHASASAWQGGVAAVEATRRSLGTKSGQCHSPAGGSSKYV